MKAVYLDQNHWIGLAQAYFGKSDDNRKVLDHAVQLVESGRAIFPVGFANTLELHKVKDKDRRKRLAEVFVFLGNGFFLAPWPSFVDAECYNAVIDVYGLEKEKVEINPVGRGIFFANGVYGFVERDLGLSPQQVRALERTLDTPEALLEFFTNPDENASARLSKNLRDQDKRYSGATKKVRDIRIDEVPLELSDYRAMEVFLSVRTHILGAHLRLGVSQEELLARGRENMLKLVAAMPAGYVDWKLGYHRDKQLTREIAPNDLADLFHLTGAIPYCDFVLTERFWTNLVSRTDVEERFGTRVLSKLTALLEIG